MAISVFLWIVLCIQLVWNRSAHGLSLGRSFHRSILSQRRLAPHQKDSIRLNLAQKSSASDKIRVRLLADTKNVGQKGDIVQVSKSMFTNVLLPQKTAVKVSEDEIKRIAEENEYEAMQAFVAAKQVVEDIAKVANRIVLKRKVGKNGQLFGAVTAKNILEELSRLSTSELLSTRGVSIVSLVEYDEETGTAGSTGSGKKPIELRKAGLFQATLHLHPDIDDVLITVEICNE